MKFLNLFTAGVLFAGALFDKSIPSKFSILMIVFAAVCAALGVWVDKADRKAELSKLGPLLAAEIVTLAQEDLGGSQFFKYLPQTVGSFAQVAAERAVAALRRGE